MDLFNQLTVRLKKQQQLKVEFVESLTELQLLEVKEKWLLEKILLNFIILLGIFRILQVTDSIHIYLL